MKALHCLLLTALLFGALVPSAVAQQSVSMDFFYDNLDPYGTWREVGNYGYCWQPQNVDQDWRPYSDGRWVYTDAGWTWDSDEPFGWAVYHYGRWANVDRYGWIWVPGTEWGPGWVSWRHSPRYVGWAPLPPEAFFLHSIGFSMWVDNYFDIGPGNYRFIENRDFGARRLNTVFIDQSQNYQIIHQTTNITHITYVNNIIHNGGPGFDQLSQQSRMPIQRYKLERRHDFEGDPRRQSAENLRSRVQGGSLSMLAPAVSDHSNAPPPRLAEKAPRTEVNHGWKNAGSTAEVQALRERMKGNARVPEALPAQPRFQRLSEPPAHRADPTGQKPSIMPPAPGVTKRDDNPRNPNTPPSFPKPPERKPQAADRPPMPAPAVQPPQPVPAIPRNDPRPEKNTPPKVERPSAPPARPKPDGKPDVRMPYPPPQYPPPRNPIDVPRFPETRRPGERPAPSAPLPPRPQAPQERIKPPAPPVPPPSARPVAPPIAPPTARPVAPPIFVPPPIPPLPIAPGAPPHHGKRPEGRDPQKPGNPRR